MKPPAPEHPPVTEHDTEVVVPGGRDVRATLDSPSATEPEGCVVACPPHPQMGGRRTDARLRAVSDALADHGAACLRFDYGDWDEGYGERADALAACRWAAERYARVALFGYSFGGATALLAAARAAEDGPELTAVAALAPAARLAADLDAAAALAEIEIPVQVVYGSRDDTAEWEPVVERARTLGLETVEMSADHHFVGQAEKVAGHVRAFLQEYI